MSLGAAVAPDRVQALRGHAAMLVFAALVAGSFSLGAQMAREIDPGVLMLLRFALATVVVGLVLRMTSGRAPRVPSAPWRYLLLGGAFAFYFVMMFEGLTTASSVSSSVVFTLTPIMTAVFAWPLLGQRLPGAVWAALGLGGIGAIWVIFGGDLSALLAFDIGRGEAIFFFGCISHAIYTPLSRYLNRGETAVQAAFGVMAGGTVLLAFYAVPRVNDVAWSDVSLLAWGTLVYLVFFTTALTTILLQYAAMRLPSSKVMAYTYLVPSCVVVWDLALGIAPPPAIILLGVAVTIAALLVLLGRDG